MKKEIQVNVIDLIKYVCKQWKILLIGSLCGMILASGIYCAVGVLKQTSEDANTQSVDQVQTLDTLRAQLTEEESVEVEQALDFYLTSQKNYEQLKEYTVNSLIYKIEAANTPTYRLVYSVKGISTTGENFKNEIGVIFENWIRSDEAIQMISNQIDFKMDSIYVKELIGIAYDELTNCFVITVVSPDKEMTEALATAIDVAVAQNTKKIEGNYSEIKIEKLLGVFSVEVNNSLQAKQYSMMQQLHAAKSVLTVYRYELSNEQQLYYNALLLGEEESQDSTPQVKEEISLFDVKIALLGVIAGGFVMVFIVLLKYLLSDVLKVKEDIIQTFNQYVFGELEVGKVNQNDWNVLCQNIKFVGAKKNIRNLLVAGSYSDEEVDLLKKQIRDELVDSFEQIDVKVINKNSDDFVKHIQNQDGVLCVEKIQKSSYTNIQHEIEVFEYYEIPLLGFVLVK